MALKPVKYRLVIAYDGTAYQGWQTQKTGIGVQQKIEEAMAKLFPSAPRLHSSSRTDTGVHALGMVAHFEAPRVEAKMSGLKLGLALNAWLPPDIRVVRASRANEAFHARFDASSKQYRYFVWNHSAMNPLVRHTAWHVPKPLNLGAIKAAARFFAGKHDFASFTSTTGHERESTVRTVYKCDVRHSGGLLVFSIEGDGFLYKMCRGIAGTLVQCGLGKFSPQAVPEIFKKKDRRVAGMTAPAHGLVLWKVFYKKRSLSATGRQHRPD